LMLLVQMGVWVLRRHPMVIVQIML
jgi:hypothetical protein